MSTVETVLRDELARADRALNAVAPVLGHLLASTDRSLVSDAIVARVRGMLVDIAGQLTATLPANAVTDGPAQAAGDEDPVETLAGRFANDAATLGFVHAAAMEAILTERLDQRAGIDPVLSPLWQELIASSDAATSELAMQALAAQSRFLQTQRRMQYPLAEMPPELLEQALLVWMRATPDEDTPRIAEAIRALRAEYDEAHSRIGLIARLMTALRGGTIAALELEHAGLALFASALAQRTGRSRVSAVLACHDRQTARLALMLRAAGLEALAIERQFLVLEPAERLPHALTDLGMDAARALLDQSGSGRRETPLR